MKAAGADGGETAGWRVALVVVDAVSPVFPVRTPTLDRSSRAQAASVVAAGAQGGKPTLRSVDLPVPVAAPAGDFSCLVQTAAVGAACADGAKAARRGVGLPGVVASPTDDRSRRAQAAGVEVAGADGAKAAIRHTSLTVLVVSPALDISRFVQAAGVTATGADGGDTVRLPGIWCARLPTAVASPAGDFSCRTQATGVGASGADGSEAVRGHNRRAVQPVACPGVGGEVRRLGWDGLSIGGNEGELDLSVVQQAGADAADLGSIDRDGAAAQPAVHLRGGGEEAGAREHSFGAVCRLPAELGAAVGEAASNNAATGFGFIFLRAGVLSEAARRESENCEQEHYCEYWAEQADPSIPACAGMTVGQESRASGNGGKGGLRGHRATRLSRRLRGTPRRC